MELIVAKNAGFCFGVRRAVTQAQEMADGKPLYTYGELIHNSQEIERLRQMNIHPISDLETPGLDRVIIRAHGVGEGIIDKLIAQNTKIIDLTCPYVKKIHKIVNRYCNLGYKIVIIGDGNHPEVIGISGWCNGNFIVVSSPQEAVAKVNPAMRICVVAQTTITQQLWDDVSSVLVHIAADAILHNTICSATSQRQKEAMQIASKADAMIVIGGKHSSNTKKLYEVCLKVCHNTYHIEDASELDRIPKNFFRIGITAGASTPDHIIKEVIKTMANMEHDEQNFEALLDQSLKTLNTGDTVKGIVAEVRPTEVVLELDGCKYNGIIKLSDLTEDPTVHPEDIVKKGDEIEALVMLVSDRDGQVLLSKKRVEMEKNLQALEAAYENGDILTGKVVEVLNNGLNLLCNNIKVFVPASHAAERYIADLTPLKGQEFPFKIIDFVQGRRRKIVGSIKNVLKEETKKKKEAFWASAEVGKVYTGEVKSVTDFGAFVDLGGIDGLVHITELSWNRIKHPSEVVKVGDTLEVYIKALDKEKEKISLGYKKEADNPWTKFIAEHKVGDIVTGTVARLVPFGAFVDLGGVDGLIHISELSWRRIAHPSEVLKEGQVVEVNIKDIDEENKKIALGYKRIEDNPWEIFKNKYNVGDVVTCKVVRLASFGAFAEIIEGVDGLIHISQIADQRIDKVSSVLSVGQEVQAKITEIKEDGKVSLSIRALLEEAPSVEDMASDEPASTEEETAAQAQDDAAAEEPAAPAQDDAAEGPATEAQDNTADKEPVAAVQDDATEEPAAQAQDDAAAEEPAAEAQNDVAEEPATEPEKAPEQAPEA